MMHELSEREELLLMKYHDGAANAFERSRAHRLLRKNSEARAYLEGLSRVEGVAKEYVKEVSEEANDLWNQVALRINQEEKLEVWLGERKHDSKRNHFDFSAFTPKEWGFAGALATACVAVLAFYVGPLFQEMSPTAQIATESSTATTAAGPKRLPAVSLVSDGATTREPPRLLEPEMPYGVEVDWMRSQGSVRMIQDPSGKSAIIWVKPRRHKIGSKATRKVLVVESNTE